MADPYAAIRRRADRAPAVCATCGRSFHGKDTERRLAQHVEGVHVNPKPTQPPRAPREEPEDPDGYQFLPYV